jgi:hypothetical protein
MPRIQPEAVQCQPLPAPAEWFMEERVPDLTQRMLKEFFRITGEGDQGLIALKVWQNYVSEINTDHRD